MIEITKVDHSNLTVQNIEATIQFYKSLFPFKTRYQKIYNGKPHAILDIPETLSLTLYEGEVKKGSVNHFGFHIKNFNQILSVLKKNKVQCLYGGIVDYKKSQSIYIKDPNGYEIELSSHFAGK